METYKNKMCIPVIGLVVACLLLAPSTAELCPSRKLLTFNTALCPLVDEYESRRHLIPEALKAKTDVDVMCLQEVWYEQDLTKILDAVRTEFPYSYSFIHHAPNQLRPEDSVWSWLFSRLRTSPCITASTVPFGYCMITQCHGVPHPLLLRCLVQRCTQHLEAIPQECISCLLMSSAHIWPAIGACSNALSYYNRMNGQALLLLSKYPITNVNRKLYYPGVKQLLARGYITADVEGLGKVVCTHFTANIPLAYLEWNRDQLRATSWEQQQRNEINLLQEELRGQAHILMGDLNSGPAVNTPGRVPIFGEFADNFGALMSHGYTSLYEIQDGRCTWCEDNVLHPKNTKNKIMDHIMLRGFSGRNATRTLGLFSGKQLSDHYGETLNVCFKN